MKHPNEPQKSKYSHEQLIEILMDPSISKCEIEWAAYDEINKLHKKIEELEQWKIDAMSSLGYNTDYSKKQDETDRLKYKIEQLQETLQFAINNPDFISSNSDDFKTWKNSYCGSLLIPEKW